MFEVGLGKVGSGTDVKKRGVIVVDATMKAMRIFMTGEKVVFDAFGARACVAEGTGDFLSNDGSIMVGADGTELGFNGFVF
jgi:hypothetical protein